MDTPTAASASVVYGLNSHMQILFMKRPLFYLLLVMDTGWVSLSLLFDKCYAKLHTLLDQNPLLCYESSCTFYGIFMECTL